VTDGPARAVGAAALRVGVVGGGFIAGIHLAAWRQLGAARLVVFDVHPERTRARASAVGAEPVDSLGDLIAAVDVVDVCTPTDTHRETVEAAAAGGRDVICEKPIARSLSDALALTDACARAGVRLLVAHVVRYFPEYAAAQAAVAAGRIGRPAVLRLRRESSRPRKAAESWIFDETRSGGLILDLMVHEFDFARWVAGEVESVMARQVRDASGRDVDFAIAILRHAGGALTHVTGGWGYPPPVFRTGFELAGDAGLIEYESVDQQPIARYLLAGGAEDAPGMPDSPVADDPFTLELGDFARALTTGAEPRVAVEDGIAALRVALAAIESSRRGLPVAIGDVR
jgi:myo-inositol 2-dehydrogenase / D-chiro-inositol 1-dehydrogenase